MATGAGELLGLTQKPEWSWALGLAVIAYFVGTAAMVDLRVQRRRDRFIRSALTPDADLDEVTRATFPSPAPVLAVAQGARLES